MRCDGRLWGRCRYRSLTRRRCGCLGFACAGDQHHSKHRKRRSKNDRFFHSVNYFFTNNSSQIALPDVLKEKNSRTQPLYLVAEIRRLLQDVCPLHVDLPTLFLYHASFPLRFKNASFCAISAARRFCSACSTASSNRSRASLRFCACERESCTVTLTPLGR